MTESGGFDWKLGGIDARVTMLEKRVAVVEREIKTELKLLNEKIDHLGDSIIASRSGWKAIIWFLGLVSALGTAAMTLHRFGVIR